MAMRLARVHRDAAALACAAVLVAGVAACSAPAVHLKQDAGRPGGSRNRPAVTAGIPAGIHKIKHVIIVMQENRSFDTYFGTYPGADGIPMRHSVPAVCVPKPGGGCGRPYHDTADINLGAPHNQFAAHADVDSGKMNGFIWTACRRPGNPACPIGEAPDVMGYHTAAEIPSYWAYARHFALDDHMFEPVRSWSLPDHEYLVSAWSASTTT